MRRRARLIEAMRRLAHRGVVLRVRDVLDRLLVPSQRRQAVLRAQSVVGLQRMLPLLEELDHLLRAGARIEYPQVRAIVELRVQNARDDRRLVDRRLDDPDASDKPALR
jgi:hypothetical protein